MCSDPRQTYAVTSVAASSPGHCTFALHLTWKKHNADLSVRLEHRRGTSVLEYYTAPQEAGADHHDIFPMLNLFYFTPMTLVIFFVFYTHLVMAYFV